MTDETRAAWEKLQNWRSLKPSEVLACFGFERCDWCGGAGEVVVHVNDGDNRHDEMRDHCYKCEGEGWVRP